MRLIELTDLYRPAIGGLERLVAVLSEGLARRGHEVYVVTSAVPGAPAVETHAGVTVHRLPLLYQKLAPGLGLDAARPFHPPAPDPLFRRLLAEVVQDVKPDVIHAHGWGVFSCLARTSPRTPVMMTAHDYGLACVRRSLTDRSGTLCSGPSWRRCGPCAGSQYGLAKGHVLAAASLSSRRLLKKVATFTAVSDYVASQLSPTVSQVGGQPVRTLHPFVPDGLYESGWQAERPGFLPAEDGYLLYVGQLSRHKGIDVLLDAYRRLVSPPPLVMLGTPHPTSPADESLPAGVTMRTSVAHPAVIAAMVRAACVVVPSVWPDPFPNTVSEAQNCGVPVIASAVGGIPEQILDGQTGWLVPAGNQAALADRLAELLASGDRARAMGAAGRLHGRQFTAAHGIPLFEEALQATAQTAGQGRLPLGAVGGMPSVDASPGLCGEGPEMSRARTVGLTVAILLVASLGVSLTLAQRASHGSARRLPAVPKGPAVLDGRVGDLKEVNYYPAAGGWAYMWTHFHPTAIDRDFTRIRALGANTVRIFVQPSVFGFPAVQPVMADRLSEVVGLAAKHSLRVHLTLFDLWSRFTDIDGSKRWVSSLLSRYRDDPRIAVVELHNEINPQDPQAVAWVTAMLPYLSTVMPGTLRTVSTASVPPGVFALFTHELKNSPPSFWDYHYYGPAGDAYPRLSSIKTVAAPRPLFVGETGYSTDGTPGDQAALEQAQAAYYRAIFAVAAALDLPRPAPWILNDFYPRAIPPGRAADEPIQYGFGLFQLNGTPKPAAAVVRRAFSAK